MALLYTHSFFFFSRVVKLLLLATMAAGLVLQVESLSFRYPVFLPENRSDFVFQNAVISNDTIQTPTMAASASKFNNLSWRAFYEQPFQSLSGRALYKQPFKLWDSKSEKKASFTSSFVASPGGDGLAFILSRDSSLPNNSAGQWIGIMNASTIGQNNNIVAVEFDTMKSYPADIDDNHVGVDVNSIYSIKQEPLGPHGVNLSSGNSVLAMVQYDAVISRISVFVGEDMRIPVLTVNLDLSDHLSEDVFVGFSTSAEVNSQLTSIKAWEFTSFETTNRWYAAPKRDPRFNWIFVLVVSIIITMSGISCTLYWKRKLEKKGIKEIESAQILAAQKFTRCEIVKVTDNFNPNNILGRGGFGTVYKGFLRSKLKVAVKKIPNISLNIKPDIIVELSTISRIHHRNLVKLLGWCHETNELFLVYDFMPNGSLDKFLFGGKTLPSSEGSTLRWQIRHRIIYEVARALDYLHDSCEPTVIHRSITASNILLDADFHARLGDGLTTAVLIEKTNKLKSVVVGTAGYIAPEYVFTGRATVKTDVYAFGILTLEIVSGRKCLLPDATNHRCYIVDWVWELYATNNMTEVVDKRLNGDFDEVVIKHAILLGLACCHPNPDQRPTMGVVLQVLEGTVDLPVVPVEKPMLGWLPEGTSTDEDSIETSSLP